MTPFTEYLHAGLSVIPIANDGTKSPAGVKWREFIDHPPSKEECEYWAGRHKGIAIVCGKSSGNLEVIDVDDPALARPFLEAVKSESPTLYEMLTLIRTPRRDDQGRGGCHVYYRCEAVQGNQKLAMSEPRAVVGDDGKPLLGVDGEQRTAPQTLIETRGHGGYVLAPGCSPECHPSGNAYDHVAGPAITSIATITPEQRDILFRCARLFDRSIAETHREPKTERFDNGDRPGDIFATRVTWQDILEPHGWEHVGQTGDVARWRRPGKTQGWSATTGIESKEGNSLLCVFSSNAHPFEGPQSGRACSTYSKFSAYAILNHNGDYQAAARKLSDLGYGDKPKQPQQPARLLLKTLRQYVGEYIATLEQDGGECIETGIPHLDEAIGGGLAPGELVVIGAYSSHGKTALAFQMLIHSSAQNRHGLIVSQEMPGISLGKRALQRMSPLHTSEWRRNIASLRKHEQEMNRDGFILVVETQPNITAVERSIRQACKEFPLTYVVVDYIQLVPSDGDKSTRYETVSEVSRRLKQLATEEKVILIAPAQCSDRQQAKQNKPPTEHDLRDSGNIANDADVIMLAHWPWKNDPEAFEDRRDEYTLYVSKNRNREIVHPAVNLSWNSNRQTFSPALNPYKNPSPPKATQKTQQSNGARSEPKRYSEFNSYSQEDF